MWDAWFCVAITALALGAVLFFFLAILAMIERGVVQNFGAKAAEWFEKLIRGK